MFWILKSEPSAYSYADLEREKVTRWDGVRNYQARNNLREMKLGDGCLFYESIGPKQIIGTAKVVKTAYEDPQDSRFSCVDVKVGKRLKNPISLAELKAHPTLKNISLVKQSRLSVCPISEAEWEMIVSVIAS